LAIQRAALLDAPPWLSANTEAPRASGFMNASAWIETKRSAWTRRAFLTRSCSGTKKSASRVIIARMFGTALRRSRRSSAIARTTSFSCSPLGPLAPGSSPPWPGSIATTTRRSIFACASCGGSAAPAGSRPDDEGEGSPVGARAPGGAEAANGGAAGSAERDSSAGAGGVGRSPAPGVDAAAPAAPTRPMNSPRASWTARAAFSSACSRSRIRSSSGIALLGRVEVEDEAMPVRGDRARARTARARSPA
jgi:hypothetical protein